MIAQIIVGAGNKRTNIALPRDRDTRRDIANKIKGHLFGGKQQFVAALERGKRALAGAAA